MVQGNGFTLSDFSVTNAVFDATLPFGFESNPTLIDPIFQQGITALSNSSTFSHDPGPDSHGISFGDAGDLLGSGPYAFLTGSGPSNLDSWLYVGNDTGFSPNGFVGAGDPYRYAPNNAEIVEIEYRILSDEGNFSRVSFVLADLNLFAFDNIEGAAIAVLFQIYSGTSDQLLGEARLLGTVSNGVSAPFDFNSRLEIFSLNEDFLRFKTTALVVGPAEITSFFNEFEVTETLVGDVSLDGVVNFGDIPAFIEILISGQFEARADIDLDGEVTFADIPPFIEILVDL